MLKNSIISLVALFLLISCGQKSVSSNSSDTPDQVMEVSTSMKKAPAYNWTFLGTGDGFDEVLVSPTEIYLKVDGEKTRYDNTGKEQIMDVAGMAYVGLNDQGQRIRVQLIESDCTTELDTNQMQFAVEITSLDELWEVPLRGCGLYQADERLSTPCLLLTLNGKKVPNKDQKAKFHLDFKSRTLAANMGCNGIGGTYTTMENRLYFKNDFISTLMFCEGVMELENAFTESIVGKSVRYSFKEDIVIIQKMNGDTVLTARVMSEM